MRKVFFPVLTLFLALILAGCDQFSTGAQPIPPTLKIQSVSPASPASGTLIVEPQAGPAPYLSLVQSARRSVDVNSYLLTDRALVSALIKKAEAGVSVRVIVDGHPYRDQNAVSRERAECCGALYLALQPCFGEFSLALTGWG